MSSENQFSSMLVKYKSSIEDVRTWAKKKYPQFLANDTLVTRLFLIQTKGLRFAAQYTPGEIKLIGELKDRKPADIQVVVVQLLDSRNYIGCPDCSKKISDVTPGKESECEKCGKLVIPKTLTWRRFLVGDSSGEIIMSIAPSVPNYPEEFQIINAQGSLNENSEFSIYRWQAKDTSEAESFKPTAAVDVDSTPTSTPPGNGTLDETLKEEKTPEVTAETTKVTCDFSGCGKKFDTDRQLAGHKKFHKKVESSVPQTHSTGAPVIDEVQKRFMRVQGIVGNKTLEEIKVLFADGKWKLPEGVTFEQLMEAANCMIKDGKVVFIGGA